MPEFRGFPKITRFEKFLNSPVTITEKLDGTNACVVIVPEEDWGNEQPLHVWTAQENVWGMFAQSRKNIITPGKGTDNFGFAQWVKDHCVELTELSHGHHYGEWWGGGIQRGYGLDKDDKRFSLFNVARPPETLPDCCSQVPILDQHTYDVARIESVADVLRTCGSAAAPGYDDPEGVMLWVGGIRQYFKMPFDQEPKGQG